MSATIQEISVYNSNWGICGFASTIAALCQNKVVSLGVPTKYLDDLLLDVIAEYLNTLLKERSPLVTDIEVFTKTFEGFRGFTVADFIQRIYNADILSPFGVAMTSKAMVDFLNRNGARAWLSPIDPKQSNVILGLGTGEPAKIEKGLLHWVYKFNAKQVYNYGAMVDLTTVQKGELNQVVFQICL